MRAGLRNPVKVSVKVEGSAASQLREQVTPATLDIQCLLCPAEERLNQLVDVLRGAPEGAEAAEGDEPRKILVFFATCACVDYFGKLLPALAPLKSRRILALHGKMVPKVGGRVMLPGDAAG